MGATVLLLQFLLCEPAWVWSDEGEDLMSGELNSAEGDKFEAQLVAISRCIDQNEIKQAGAILQDAYDGWRASDDRELREWRSDRFSELVGHSCSRGSDAADALGREFAKKAIAHPEDLTATAELDLVLRANSGIVEWVPREERATATVDPVMRALSANWCCHAIARFKAEYDPSWRPSEGSSRVLNPAFTGPDAKAQRERYREQARIAGFREIKQQHLRRAERGVVPRIERHLVELYSRRPRDAVELSRLLGEHGIGSAIADRIMGGLKVCLEACLK